MDINMDINIEDWTIVKHIQKKPQNIEIYNPSFEEIKNGIVKTLQKYNPYAIYIYGSRARGTHTINSDVDILVIWTSEYDSSHLEIIKDEIKTEIKIKIDFVNLVYKKSGKKIKTDQRDIFYYENLIIEAKNIYKKTPDKIYLMDIIPFSIKLPKV